MESIETTLETTERTFARVWKVIAAGGIVAIAFGIVLLVWPDIGLSAMTAFVGAFALVSGIFSGAAVFAVSDAPGRFRLWLGLQSALGIAVGVAVLVWPDLSAKAVLYWLAIWAIAAGIAELAGAIALPLQATRSLLLALSGIILVAFGVIMFVEPGDGAIALLSLVAALAIVRGVFDIALADELRKTLAEVKKHRPVQATPVAHG
jgi:uncharacterized membrane protein HdeD (DUF308 family)